jgi:hypothetical protein
MCNWAAVMWGATCRKLWRWRVLHYAFQTDRVIYVSTHLQERVATAYFWTLFPVNQTYLVFLWDIFFLLFGCSSRFSVSEECVMDQSMSAAYFSRTEVILKSIVAAVGL